MASFLREAWRDKTPPREPEEVGTTFVHEEVGPDGEPWADMEWARGKTVLVLADSVLRYMAQYFCHVSTASPLLC